MTEEELALEELKYDEFGELKEEFRDQHQNQVEPNGSD